MPTDTPLNPTRRQVLGGAMAFGGGWIMDGGRAARTSGAGLGSSASRSARAAGSDLGAIEHVIFLMQENRSFDHYFGTYPGVRGFNDHPATRLGPFAQPDPLNTTRAPTGYQLPFHLDTATGRGECTYDPSHDWVTQQRSRNGGAMNAFVAAHSAPRSDGPREGLSTMGYYERRDLPYHYALADAFTICDNYHCSILGPTHPNRLMALSGSIDPAGLRGGPVITTQLAAEALFSAHWTTVPELLEDAGVSWKTYTTPGEGFYAPNPDAGFGDAILPYFAQYKNPRSSLYQKAFLPTYPADFARDVRSSTLPHVSWIISPNGYDEHPPTPPNYGAWFLNRVLRTLMANREVWSKTVVFITYDENGGYFDHVAPPVAPSGTTGEYLSGRVLPRAAGGIAGPLGLGFRVPMLVVSPFARGGFISSEVFDHTSQIRFLEERFGVRATEISAWRRRAVGDLTGTLRMNYRNLTAPFLPNTGRYRVNAVTRQGCTPGDLHETSVAQPEYPMATPQSMPRQSAGPVRRLDAPAP